MINVTVIGFKFSWLIT